jgi:hypothetical protein
MSLYTSNYLKSIARSYTINENRRQLFSANENAQFDIFLSHSFLDREEVKGLYIELTNLGYSVYVDWIIDSHLDRTNVTKRTAELIRKRLKCSKTLLLAISANAEMSKWMPWELGYVDGNTNKCAIIPVSKDNTTLQSFKRVEYLLLYPFIKKEKNTLLQDKLWAVEESDVYILFEQWIKGSIPFRRETKIF